MNHKYLDLTLVSIIAFGIGYFLCYYSMPSGTIPTKETRYVYIPVTKEQMDQAVVSD